MKYSIIVLLSTLSLFACDKQKKTNGLATPVVHSEPVELERKEPQAQTITIKEVSRIALVEAKQFLTNAKNNKLDISTIMPVYDKAQKAYNQGDYKQAQKIAVEVRQHVEDLTNIK